MTMEAFLKAAGDLAKESVGASKELPGFAKELKSADTGGLTRADLPLFRHKELSLKEIYSEAYEKKLKDLSPYPETVPNINISDWEKISPEEVRQMRLEFAGKKDELIREWEMKHGREWPRYEQDIYNEYGTLIRQKGDLYDAHHIRPLEFGGENSADNITPLHAKDHYDHQGIHSKDGIYKEISDYIEKRDVRHVADEAVKEDKA